MKKVTKAMVAAATSILCVSSVFGQFATSPTVGGTASVNTLGTVGIGTAAPETALHLKSDGWQGSSLTLERSYTTRMVWGPIVYLRASSSDATGTAMSQRMLGSFFFEGAVSQNVNKLGAVIRAVTDGNWTNSGTTYTTPTRIEFYTNMNGVLTGSSKPTMTLKDNGNLGIGTDAPTAKLQVLGNVVIGQTASLATPAGYNLYVETGILTEKVKVAVKNTTDWSDYVFADDYELKNLDEVESFIAQNKHLPGVPSANEVVANGLDVAQTDAMLLQKIEELTLYVIAQQKQIEALKAHVK